VHGILIWVKVANIPDTRELRPNAGLYHSKTVSTSHSPSDMGGLSTMVRVCYSRPRPLSLNTSLMRPVNPRPKMRDVLVRDYPNYVFQDVSFHYFNTFSINWPYGPTDVLLPTPGSSELCINPVFERHLRDLNNWSLGPEFRDAFPDLCRELRIMPRRED
jgi:hypothetical protein